KDASALGLGQSFARAKQGLGRHAAPVGALAPDQLPLDDRECQPAVPEARRDRCARDPAPQTPDIELLRHTPSLTPLGAANSRGAGRAPPLDTNVRLQHWTPTRSGNQETGLRRDRSVSTSTPV